MPPTTPGKFTPSKSVQASYKKENELHDLKISGRAPSLFTQGSQGDHVTAYRLIEEGLYRAVSGLENKEVEELHWLENRESLRKKRERLYDFISAIGALREEDVAKEFLGQIDELLEKYNKKRHKKSEIRKATAKAQGDMSLTKDYLKDLLKGVESKYRFNGELIRDFFLESGRLLLTFYNKTPNSSYLPIDGFKPPAGEGGRVAKSLKIIRIQIEECAAIKDNSAALTAKLSNYLVPALLDLIHYPEIIEQTVFGKGGKKKITAQEILQKHQIHTGNYGLKKTRSRTNEKSDLVNILAKHMHIVVAVYPELEDIFDVNDIISDFVEKFIKRKPFGWPQFKKAAEIEDITKKVKEGFQALQTKTADRHYTEYKEYDELVSSSDEEEVTTPSPRKMPALILKKASAKKLGKTSSLSDKFELAELRKFLGIIKEEVKIPKTALKRIKKECPMIAKKLDQGVGAYR